MKFLKNIEVDLEQLRKAAENGDKNAICEYAWELADHKKLSDAFKWFEMSKDLNDPDVWGSLAVCYLYGKGTDKNIKEAIKCFLSAVELGELGGVYWVFWISHIYDEYVNFDEVVRIFEQLNNNLPTEYVDVEATSMLKFMLACCYYWGVGTEQDKENAKKLLKSAGYDFDEDKTPLFIKEMTMSSPFPKRIPICSDFLIPLQKNYYLIDSEKLFNEKLFNKHYHFLDHFNLSFYSRIHKLYDFFKVHEEDVDLWFYLQIASEKNANIMYDALQEGSYEKFRDACIDEPYFAGRVLLYNSLINKLKTKCNYSDNDFLSFDSVESVELGYGGNGLFIKIPGYSYLEINNQGRYIKPLFSIRYNNISIIKSIFACYLTQSVINECNTASNLTVSENKKYNKLTELLNQPKFYDEINEFKRYCINTPEILDLFELTKEELSSIFGIVDESPVDIDETINFKDSIIPETYKCEIFDGCEKVYEKFFEKLKGINYIDESTSFESFRIAIGLVPKPKDGVFKRVIWKSMYGNRAYWKPLLNMLRLIGINREDLKPKTLNSLFVHSTGQKIDSNVIKVHKATALIEINGKKQSIHKHLCEFLEKSGFPSDKLIHNLDE